MATHSTNSVRGFPFLSSIPSLATVICRLFNDGHSDQCEVVPHCSFDMHFSEISDVEHLFICPLAICEQPFFFLTKVYSKELYCTIVVMLPESFMPGRATTLEQQMITLHREIVSRA